MGLVSITYFINNKSVSSGAEPGSPVTPRGGRRGLSPEEQELASLARRHSRGETKLLDDRDVDVPLTW